MPTLPLQPLNSQVLETNIVANDVREFLNQPPSHFIGHDGNTLEMSGDPDFDKLKWNSSIFLVNLRELDIGKIAIIYIN